MSSSCWKSPENRGQSALEVIHLQYAYSVPSSPFDGSVARLRVSLRTERLVGVGMSRTKPRLTMETSLRSVLLIEISGARVNPIINRLELRNCACTARGIGPNNGSG